MRQKECWYKNNTQNDIRLNDLGVKIPAGKPRNLFQLRPSLNWEQVQKSEQEGLLAKCVRANKLIKLPAAPPPAQDLRLTEEITEAKNPLPTRSKSSVVMDAEELDYIEDMESEFKPDDMSAEKYANYAEGFADPITLGSERDDFEAVVVPSGEDGDEEEVVLSGGDPVETETQAVGSGNNRYLVVGPNQ